ncbi:transcription/translation regulatory transformer protein RfaH [Pseudidiomarina taiwanensis]|uniref:Transcription/translation regulatory transformer protein RfaH n=1 Tax=Pseudidiomarina taiwanensis TaxID=337250 RepID=A0A432ZKQ8_9GAMM|nr:transcription/translation regulatory transformer protein RfaH [Pseudidiomarina taiwanensis]RUO78420.1 transcription/translation regulatory transformer protein RfaH [Pseudidiomarina taiwanensis]
MSTNEKKSIWYVVRSKPRQEQRAKLNLENQGIKTCLPMLDIEKIKRGKKTLATEPLFPGYLFIEVDDFTASFHKVRNTFGVSKILMFGERPATLSHAQIEAMSELNEAKEKAQKYALPQSGEEVEITEGPFKGFLAKVVKLDGEERCIVLINWLSQDVKAQLNFNEIRINR